MLFRSPGSPPSAHRTQLASATVVQTQAGFDGLKAANQAVLDWATNRRQVTNDVSTVAQVTITSGADAREQATADLVVNIDYVKN